MFLLRIERIVSVFFRATNASGIFTFATFLIWPLASVYAIIVDKTLSVNVQKWW